MNFIEVMLFLILLVCHCTLSNYYIVQVTPEACSVFVRDKKRKLHEAAFFSFNIYNFSAPISQMQGLTVRHTKKDVTYSVILKRK